jgi:4'-phosphopantetheinyl transferase EntD
VVLDRSPPLRSLGLDVETNAPLEAGTRAQILTPAERPWLAAMPTGRRDELALLVFSAKEAYYKCQYPLSGVVLDFQDVEVEIDLPRARFEARARKPGLPADLARLTGRCASAEGRVMCGVTVTGSR